MLRPKITNRGQAQVVVAARKKMNPLLVELPPVVHTEEPEGEEDNEDLVQSSLKDDKDLSDKGEDTQENIQPGIEKQTLDSTALALDKDRRQLIEKLYGENPTISIIGEDGEESDRSLSEIEVIDDVLYNNILDAKLDNIKEETSKGKVAIDKLSPYMQKVLKLDEQGEDVSGLMKIKETFLDPLEKYDLTNPIDQKKVLQDLHRVLKKKESESSILIEAYEQKGTLEQEAFEAADEIKSIMDQQIDKAVQMSRDAEEAFKTQEKEYKKNLKSVLDSNFELNDTVKAKLVNISRSQEKDGKYSLDKIYEEHLTDPEKSARLVLFLYDTEEYNKQVTTKKVNETKLTSAAKIRVKAGSSIAQPLINHIPEPTRTVVSAKPKEK